MGKREDLDHRQFRINHYKNYVTAVCLTVELLPWDSVYQMAEALHRTYVAGGQVYVIYSDECQSTAIHIAQIFQQLMVNFGSQTRFSVALIVQTELSEEDARHTGLPLVTEQMMADSLSEKDILLLVGVAEGETWVKSLTKAQEQQVTVIGWMYQEDVVPDTLFDIVLKVPNEYLDQVAIAFELVANMLVADFGQWLSVDELASD